jgi:hypothetical protein
MQENFFGHKHHTIATLDNTEMYASNNFSGAHSASNPHHANIIADWVCANNTFMTVCDVGGANGELACKFRDRGKDPYVIDGSDWGWERGLKIGKERYAVWNMSEPLMDKLPRHSFELVTSFEFMEHVLPDAIDKVMENIRWLAPVYICSLHTGGLEAESHYLVRNLDWWKEYLGKMGDVEVITNLDVPTFGGSYFVRVKFK